MPERNDKSGNILNQIRAWHVVVVFALTLGSLVWSLSATNSTVVQNSRDIVSLDAHATACEVRLTRSEVESADRYARIETTLKSIEKKVDELNEDVKELRKP